MFIKRSMGSQCRSRPVVPVVYELVERSRSELGPVHPGQQSCWSGGPRRQVRVHREHFSPRVQSGEVQAAFALSSRSWGANAGQMPSLYQKDPGTRLVLYSTCLSLPAWQGFSASFFAIEEILGISFTLLSNGLTNKSSCLVWGRTHIQIPWPFTVKQKRSVVLPKSVQSLKLPLTLDRLQDQFKRSLLRLSPLTSYYNVF